MRCSPAPRRRWISSRALCSSSFRPPNPDGALKPGAYGQAHFPIAGTANSVTIPASALIFRGDGTAVATIDRTGKVTLHKVTIGTDRGATLEIAAGLKPGDLAVDSPPDSIGDGDRVKVEAADAKG